MCAPPSGPSLLSQHSWRLWSIAKPEFGLLQTSATETCKINFASKTESWVWWLFRWRRSLGWIGSSLWYHWCFKFCLGYPPWFTSLEVSVRLGYYVWDSDGWLWLTFLDGVCFLHGSTHIKLELRFFPSHLGLKDFKLHDQQSISEVPASGSGAGAIWVIDDDDDDVDTPFATIEPDNGDDLDLNLDECFFVGDDLQHSSMDFVTSSARGGLSDEVGDVVGIEQARDGELPVPAQGEGDVANVAGSDIDQGAPILESEEHVAVPVGDLMSEPSNPKRPRRDPQSEAVSRTKVYSSPDEILVPISPYPACSIRLNFNDHRWTATWQKFIDCDEWFDELRKYSFSQSFAFKSEASWRSKLAAVHEFCWTKWNIGKSNPNLKLADGMAPMEPGAIPEDVYRQLKPIIDNMAPKKGYYKKRNWIQVFEQVVMIISLVFCSADVLGHHCVPAC